MHTAKRADAAPPGARLTFAWVLLAQVSSLTSQCDAHRSLDHYTIHTMLGRTPKAYGHSLGHKSLQQKAALPKTKGTLTSGTLLLLKYLAAFCMLGNVTASPTTCGCSEEIAALRVEFQAKYDAQQVLIDSVAHEVQDVRECSACVSPSPPPPSRPTRPSLPARRRLTSFWCSTRAAR